MKINSTALILFICFIFSNCTSNSKYPTDKRYWTPEDYSTVIYHLTYGIEPDEKLPTFADPSTSIVIKKLTDHENYKVVLEDKELGLNHRNEVASSFFSKVKDMQEIYSVIDRKDKFVYENEMLEVYKFSLGLQLLYFKLGNDEIIKNADDPNSNHVKRVTTDNIQSLISNYNLYLNKIKEEDAFSDDGKRGYAEGITEYFTLLIETFPNADFQILERKIKLLKEKTKSEEINFTLEQILEKINSKKLQEIEEKEILAE